MSFFMHWWFRQFHLCFLFSFALLYCLSVTFCLLYLFFTCMHVIPLPAPSSFCLFHIPLCKSSGSVCNPPICEWGRTPCGGIQVLQCRSWKHVLVANCVKQKRYILLLSITWRWLCYWWSSTQKCHHDVPYLIL